MKDKVLIGIKGLHFTGDEAEASQIASDVEVVSVGAYESKDGFEYVTYDEVTEDDEKCESTVKIGTDTVEVTKKGAVNAHMSFVRGKKTTTAYDTPFGTLYVGIFTKELEVEHLGEEISIAIRYSLEMNYELVAESMIEISVRPAGEEK